MHGSYIAQSYSLLKALIATHIYIALLYVLYLVPCVHATNQQNSLLHSCLRTIGGSRRKLTEPHKNTPADKEIQT